MAEFQPVTEHIWRGELHYRLGPLGFSVVTYLIRVGESFVLVDTGPTSTADELVAAVARATEGQGPRMILLTHAHPDHAGGLEALRSVWNPPILCHKLEVGFVTGERRYRDLQARSAASWWGRFFIRGPRLELPVAKDLEGGQSVEGMSVIHLPGHTPGQIGFLHSGDSAMLCGDAVGTRGGKLRPPMALATPDPEAAHRSMRRLGELDYDHLLPAHGPPILSQGRQAVLQFLEELTEAREEEW